jgi:hypothetical protein
MDMDGNTFGKQLAARTRDIAAEVAGDIARASAEDRAMAKALLQEAKAMNEAVLTALSKATDIPEVLGLLKSQRAQAAQAESLSLQREEALLKRDSEARGLLNALTDALARAHDLKADFTTSSNDIAVWKRGAAQAISEMQESVYDLAGEVVASLHKLTEDTQSARQALSAEMALRSEFWDNDIRQATDTVSAAVAKAEAAYAALTDERRSLAASRAHVTKALSALDARADAVFSAIQADAKERLLKMTPSDADSVLGWQGPWGKDMPYLKDALVGYQGSAWIAICDSHGTPPAVVPDNPWQLFASAGIGAAL